MRDPVSVHGADGAVFHLMRRVLQRHTARWSAELPDMTKAQWAVLLAVRAEPGRDEKAIGALAAIDKATLVPLVARLADRGWLTLEVDPSDRRRRLLRLTSAGRAAVKRAQPVVAAIDAAALEPLAGRERAALRALLARLS
jgi:MarR family transcriptional regulator, temperature-dependent positive regulator of motility